MTSFKPRNEWERQACSIEPPKFNIGDRVAAKTQWGASGVVTEVILETVDYPHWTYQVDGSEACYDVHDLLDNPLDSAPRTPDAAAAR